MTDQDVRGFLARMAVEEQTPLFEAQVLTRRAHRRAARTVIVGALGVAAAIGLLFAGASELRQASPRVPANPEPSTDLGIFAPLGGRMVSYSDSGLVGFDPNAPIASALVRVDLDGTARANELTSFTLPLDWSKDGTALLFVREDPDDKTFPYDRHLYVLRADGTQTQVTSEPVTAATISPDGTRVVYASDSSQGLWIVDANGGASTQIVGTGEEPTFSPDGTQIAYLSQPREGCCVESGREHVWIVNVDGTDRHEILANEPALDHGVFQLTWSPAGDRIAMENSLGRFLAIYTFAPDGSAFTKVIDGGMNPSWSPDGSQIAYGLPGRDGVAVADADGSDVQTFGFGSWGPWHPVVPTH